MNPIVKYPVKRPDLINAYIAERIRLKRIESGMTQADIGERLGVTHQQINKVEMDKSNVLARDIIVYSNIFDCPPSYFFSGCHELLKEDDLCFSRSQIDVMKKRFERDINQLNKTVKEFLE